MKKIACCFLLLVAFFTRLCAWNANTQIHGTAVSADKEWNAVSILENETHEESIWVYRSSAHWSSPVCLIKFKTQTGWGMPSVCYDKKTGSFIVYHNCWIPENDDGGIYEFPLVNGKYKSSNSFRTLTYDKHIGVSKLFSNDEGIYLLASYGQWNGVENRKSKLFRLDRIEDTFNLVVPESLEGMEFAHLAWDADKKFTSNDNCLRDICFATNCGLIILDGNENSWWHFDCKTENVKQFDSKEAALEYDMGLKQKRTAQEFLAEKNIYVYACLFVLFFLITVCCGILLLRMYVKQNKKTVSLDKVNTKEKNQFMFSIQEAERSKISRDIHDSVIQDIRVIRLETENLDVMENCKEQQNRIKNLATECIVKLRNICYNLAPAELANHEAGDSSEIELVSIINTLAQQFSIRTHVPCSVTVDEDFKYPTFEKEKTQNLFRVAQEALTNIEKHSYATQVSIFFKTEHSGERDYTVIYITDDGIGISSEKLLEKMNGKDHLGLRSMKDRMNLIGGLIEFVSDQDCGMEVIIRI